MLKNENNAELQSQQIDDKYIFLFQLWRELTSSFTLDSYQYRLMNTISALEELSSVIKLTLDGSYNSDHNITDCKRELLSIIEKDILLQTDYPNEYRLLLNKMHSKHETPAQKKTILHHIDCIRKNIEPSYFNKTFSYLEDSISSGDLNKITYFTKQIICNLINKGWSSKALFNLICILKGSASDPNKWILLKTKICSNTPSKYYIFVPFVLKTTQHADISLLSILDNEIENIKRVDKNTILSMYPLLNSFIEDRQYVSIPVEAYDKYTAVKIGCHKYSNILNALSFYNIIRPWSFKNLNFLVTDIAGSDSDKIHSNEIYLTTDDYFEGATSAFKISKSIITSDNQILKNKLLSAYSYSNIGKETLSQEEKFINIWIALESFCKTDMYSNIIDNVKYNVPPALCMRYIFSLCRNFVDDCHRCNINFSFSTETFDMKNRSKREIVKTIVYIFNSSNLYSELLIKTSCNCLLTYRCKELHEIMTNQDKIIQIIQNHYENVELQISRLYRIRNQIAHTALDSSTPLVRYIEHLSNYLTIFVAEIVNVYKNKNLDNLSEILSYIQDNYSSFQEIISCQKKDPAYVANALKHLLDTGIISLI